MGRDGKPVPYEENRYRFLRQIPNLSLRFQPVSGLGKYPIDKALSQRYNVN